MKDNTFIESDALDNDSKESHEVFWINPNQMQITENGVRYILTPEEAKKQFANNPGIIGDIDNLLRPIQSNFQVYTPRDLVSQLDKVQEPQVQTQQDIMEVFRNDFERYSKDESVEDVDGFKSEYIKFINEMEYDTAYSDMAVAETSNYTSDERYHDFVDRTKQDKKGACFQYTLRIQDEAEKRGIETYPLYIVSPSLLHYAVLEVIDGSYYVCDPTPDITFGKTLKDQGDEIPPISFQIPLGEYLAENADKAVSVLENFKGSNKRLEQMRSFPIDKFVEARETFINRPDLVQTPENSPSQSDSFGAPGI